MLQATLNRAKLIESKKYQGQLELPLVADLQRTKQSQTPSPSSINSGCMTKGDSSSALPDCQGIITSTVNPTADSSCPTLLSCSIYQPSKKAHPSPNPSSKDFATHSEDTINQSLWRTKKTPADPQSPHQRPIESLGWDSNHSKSRPNFRLWNPQNSTPRELSGNHRKQSLEELIAPKKEFVLKPAKQIVDPDGDLPLFCISNLQPNSRHGLLLENEPGSNNSKTSLTAFLNFGRRNRRVEAAEFRKESAKALSGEIGSSIPIDTSKSLSLYPQSRLKDCNIMSDIEHGLRPRYFEDSNSFLVTQYGKRDSSSAHAAIGSLPSPVTSDNSSILGSELGEHSPEEWGPQHPCYPHRNPHVPITSPLFRSTRIIRINRDWMLEGDLAPTFSNLYPEILDPAGVSEQEFRQLLESVNREIIPAFDPLSRRNIIDGLISVLTGWIWEDVGLVGIKQKLIRIERLLEDWNRGMRDKMKDSSEESAIPRAVPLRRTGYMSIDIQVPNPEISKTSE